jgi:deoxyribonuclease V
MFVAVDTFYFENKAKTVAITFDKWNDSNYSKQFTEELDVLAEYIPGEFYKRELPCILSIIKNMNVDAIDVIIIDGYVYLDDFNKYGLGGYLYESLNKKIPIIGVAKTNFASNKENKLELFRGKSKNPLYITSIGIDIDVAKKYISTMYGEYRIPKLLKELDQLTKEKNYG